MSGWWGCGREENYVRDDSCTWLMMFGRWAVDVVGTRKVRCDVSFWLFWRELTLFFIAKAVLVIEADLDPYSWQNANKKKRSVFMTGNQNRNGGKHTIGPAWCASAMHVGMHRSSQGRRNVWPAQRIVEETKKGERTVGWARTRSVRNHVLLLCGTP